MQNARNQHEVFAENLVDEIATEIKIAEKDKEVITLKKETKDKEEMHSVEMLAVDALERLTHLLNDNYGKK